MNKLLFTLLLLAMFRIVGAQPKVGAKAPDIILPGVNGEMTSLSALKGKVVLLDFWASWCQPCRAGNKVIKPLYDRYKDQGFEIFGVSIDNNKQAWTSAVNKDNITWKQVIDTKAASGNALTQTWNLRYIPSTFLIDANGIVVAVEPSKGELENLLKKLL